MCIYPIYLKKETWKQKISTSYHMVQVPCGRCLECLKLRVNSWYVRLQNEQKYSDTSFFVTLTIDDDHLEYSEDWRPQLCYKDVQLFLKKLRKKNAEQTNKKIKYFCVGEYGSITERPHYHLIIFNCVNADFIEKCWKLGNVHIGKVEPASIYYTLKYALKRATKIKKSDDMRTVEKAIMSRGLGINFLTDEMVNFYKSDVTRGIILEDGKKLPLPRYYRDKIFTNTEKLKRNKIMVQKAQEKSYERRIDPLFPERVSKMYKEAWKKEKKTD